jgi:oligoendopeptidase F
MPKKKATKETALTWDLTDLYQGIDDPEIDTDLATIKTTVRAFEQKYRGQLHAADLTAAKLQAALEAYEACLQQLTKLQVYAQLVFMADTSKPAHGAFLQKIRRHAVELYNQLLFVELELAHLPDTVFQRLVAEPSLGTYAHYLEKQYERKQHLLSEPEEKLLQSKTLTGQMAFVRLFDEEFARQTYRLRLGKKVKKLSQAETLQLVAGPNPALRKRAAAAFTQGLKPHLSRLAYITNVLIEDKTITDTYRHYTFPEASRHQENEIEPAVVDTMENEVIRHYGLVQEFYDFKRKVLGIRTLYDYDRTAPLKQPKHKIPFATGKKLVLDAFRQFSPDYAVAAEEFFTRRWIDAALRPGKQGGAFCMYGTPDHHPYVFVNYTGTMESVMTLAHELGHGVHAMLARDNTYLNYDWPITVAETASVFGELLMFQAFKRQLTNKRELFVLYMNEIERIFATVFRQTAMYRFEQRLHRTHREKGELPAEAINAIWRETQHEMYGSSLTLTENYNLWWSYIPHFVHTPFYVYAYAFGELLTLSLYARYQTRGEAFVGDYINLLRAGGSDTPSNLLKTVGVTLDQPEFWRAGLTMIADLIAEAKALYQK